MHPEARLFLDYVRRVFGPLFYKGKVLDVGSGDINGNNRMYFSGVEYTGCDVFPGANVDIVSKCHELKYPDEYFDVIVSSECFEHDMHYEKSIAKILRLLKKGGFFVFTCASTGRAEHGTLRTTPGCSFTCRTGDVAWSTYYKNLTKNDINVIPGFLETFKYSKFYYESGSKDLYFVGIKKNSLNQALIFEEYKGPNVINLN